MNPEDRSRAEARLKVLEQYEDSLREEISASIRESGRTVPDARDAEALLEIKKQAAEIRKLLGVPPLKLGTLTESVRFDTGRATNTMPHVSMSDQWALIEKHAVHFRTMLLYGPPGTGKSFLARTAGVNGSPVFPVPVHQDLPAAELRGHFIPSQEYDEDGKPTGNPILRWADGPATMAWRLGHRLVLDEIDHAGDDALSFLLAVLDNFDTARLVLGTTGEVLSPHPSFACWATMNGELEDLPPALRDRFPVAVRITEPNPKAIAALPEDLQDFAKQMVIHPEEDRRIGLRKFMEFAKLRDLTDADTAGIMVFTPEKWAELAPAIKLGTKVDTR